MIDSKSGDNTTCDTHVTHSGCEKLPWFCLGTVMVLYFSGIGSQEECAVLQGIVCVLSVICSGSVQ